MSDHNLSEYTMARCIRTKVFEHTRRRGDVEQNQGQSHARELGDLGHFELGVAVGGQVAEHVVNLPSKGSSISE
jgi:hypothetical protein